MTDVVDVYNSLNPECLASEIATMFDGWNQERQGWLTRAKDIRSFVFDDTVEQTHKGNPYANKQRVPKLTQIYDNLMANYTASIFPSDDWVAFESGDELSVMKDKKEAAVNWIKTKNRQFKLTKSVRSSVSDWVLYGNAFAMLDYVRISGKDDTILSGPKLIRISPFDIVFNIRAESFDRTPVIIRSHRSIGQIARDIDERPEAGYNQALLDDILKVRKESAGWGTIKFSDISYQNKLDGLKADGFQTLQEYYSSDIVEVLEFRGDFYDREAGKFFKNHSMVVVDRRKVIYNQPINSINRSKYVYHVGWRRRPDTLIGQSPLEILAGMQYRIDHLENKKSDIYDRQVEPVLVETGNVEYYDAQGNENGVRGLPGGYYKINEVGGGEVKFLYPDQNALKSDMLIKEYMQWMEEYAGSPREALGFRTAGEKTAFEVNVLQEGWLKVFDDKIEQFEEEFLEPVLNDMLELGIRNIDGTDLIRITKAPYGVVQFMNITVDDLKGQGHLYAVGSRHTKKKRRIVQAIQALLSNRELLKVISPHLDRLKLGALIEDVSGLEEYDLFQKDIGIHQDAETQRTVQASQQQLQDEAVADGIGGPDAATQPTTTNNGQQNP